MKKNVVVAVIAVVLVLAVAWAAFGQAAGGGQGGGQRGAAMREAQMKALAALQEQVAKLKTMMEQAPGMQGRSFQDMSEEERTKMREEMTKRREEQQKIYASIDQELARLKGPRQLMTENEQSIAPLKDLLASAQKENAKDTVAKIQQLIDKRQKDFETKVTAMGYTMEQLQQMQQRQRPQQ
jgi:hypothetical protein